MTPAPASTRSGTRRLAELAMEGPRLKVRIVSAALSAVIALVCAPAAPAAYRGAPLPRVRHRIAVIAHRGGRALAPENTLAAFRKAIALGADYVEVDVRATRDGHLVLMHDASVDRTTNGHGAVRDLDLAAIRALDAGSRFGAEYAGERVPTLEEALGLCRGRIGIYLDHKEAPVAQVWRAVREHGMERQVIVYDGTEGLKEWKAEAPGVPVMPSLPDEYRRPGGIAAYLRVLRPEVLDGNILEWTAPLVREAHAAGIRVYVDNLGPADNPAGFRRAIAMGVDGIQTDHPDQLLRVLAERGRGSCSPTATRPPWYLDR